MDITKELLKLNTSNFSEVLNTLRQEQLISEKKTYLFEVMSFTQKMIEFAPTFIKAGCNIIEMSNVFGLGRSYCIELSPEGGRIDVRNSKGNFLPWFNHLLSIQPKFEIDRSFTNDFGRFNLDLNGDIESQMYAKLLSDEILTTLNYNKLNLRLESKDITKKIKKI